MPVLRLFLFFLSAGLAVAQPLVLTTNTILDDLVRRVGDSDVRVLCLIEPGVDPHAYEPKPADIRLMAKADIVVVNGLGLETWLGKLIANSGFHGVLVTASEGLSPLPAATDEATSANRRPDPHAWQDVRNVIRYVDNIRAALVKQSPEHAADFNARAAAFTRELEALQAYAVAQFATLPEAHRKLVTSHDALGYLARGYGLTIVPISGLSPDQEPDARQLARIITFIRRQHVPAVFIESTSNPKIPELIAREAGVAVAPSLYTDSLAAPGSPEASYPGMFRHNVDTIVRALR
ncbi:MAG: zinc ABC transporter substrate-binding protein [Verrucomicrobia bacterium]|nr:zinc ABC transporter substrate-binding protein [Verrucomicrobiota bacterium]